MLTTAVHTDMLNMYIRRIRCMIIHEIFAFLWLSILIQLICSITNSSIFSLYFRQKPSHDRKFIVFEWNLLSLFTICQLCSGSTNAAIRQVMGTFISIYQDCSCGWSRTWNSQPFVGNMPAGNLLLSASILFSGCVPSKVLRVLNHAKIQSITVMTFFNHQKGYLIPTINKIWERRQNEQITKLRQRGPTVGVGGDGRADSPGHSAKYGSYTMIHLESGKVLDIQLVQVLNS